MFDNLFSCCRKDFSLKNKNIYLNYNNNNNNINKNFLDSKNNSENNYTIKHTLSYNNNISQKVISRNTANVNLNNIENSTSKNIINSNNSNTEQINNIENNNNTEANNNIVTKTNYNSSTENIKNTETNNSNTNSNKFKNSYLSFSNFPISPPQETISIPKELKLLLSGSLFFDKEIIITNKGMVNGLRNKEDGQVFFGLKNTKDYTGTYYNDFVLNFQYNSNEINDTSTSRVFDITFSKKTRDYVFYMLHNSLIVYYTISSTVYFEQDKDYYVLIGNIFVTFLVKKIENNKKVIHVEIENDDAGVDNVANETYSFEEKDCPITIGRINCKVNINKPSVSKNHSVIEFSKNLNKFYFKDLKSTNGSILLLKDDDTLVIKGEMNFKLENIPFKITEIPY